MKPPGVVVDAASGGFFLSNSFRRSSFSVYISFWLSFAITSTMCTYEPVALGRIQLNSPTLASFARFLSLDLHARHFIPYSLSNTPSNYHTNSRDTYLFFELFALSFFVVRFWLRFVSHLAVHLARLIPWCEFILETVFFLLCFQRCFYRLVVYLSLSVVK